MESQEDVTMQGVITKFKEGLQPLINDTTSLEVFYLLIDEMIPALCDARRMQAFKLFHAYNKVIYQYKTIDYRQFVSIEELMLALLEDLEEELEEI